MFHFQLLISRFSNFHLLILVGSFICDMIGSLCLAVNYPGMHAFNGNLSGQAFAFASGNDKGGKKSRIRRSKEERKGLVESFIKRFQKTNDGNFPSLNLTHKEVGGSFYTVREIVREIIQENRVLAPPKLSLEEYDHSGFLEQHPLGSISMESHSDLSISDGIHIMPSENQNTSDEYNSSIQFHGGESLELDSERILNGVSSGIDDPALNHYQHTNKEKDIPNSEEFENEVIVNGGEALEHNSNSEAASSSHQHSNSKAILSTIGGEQGSQIHTYEHQYAYNQIVDKTKQQTSLASIVVETIEREKDVANAEEASQYVISNVVVETFPLRPVSSTILGTAGGSEKLHEAASILEDEATRHDRNIFDRRSSNLVNQTDDKDLLTPTVELFTKLEDEKVVPNLQEPSVETSKVSTTSKQSLLDTDYVKDLEPKDPLPDGTRVGSSFEQLTSEISSCAGRKCIDREDSSSPKGSNPTLNRINLGTQEGESKNSARQDSNPLVAIVKAFVSAFVKFWTD